MTGKSRNSGTSPADGAAQGTQKGPKAASGKTSEKIHSQPPKLRVADLAARRPTPFVIEPDADARAALAEELGLLSLPRLRFEGRLEPQGRRDWQLTARLGATVVQPCVATLEPVRTRIDEDVERIFAADWAEPEGEELEMPEDDRLEPLPEVIDTGRVMAEALALALPLYPRSDAAAVGAGDGVHAPPGAAPLTDDAVRPFAGLEALRGQLLRRDGEDRADEGEDTKPRKS